MVKEMTWRWFDCMTNTYHDIEDEMTLDEQVFSKMGFTWGLSPALLNQDRKDKWAWRNKNGLEKREFVDLPKISSQWEVCAKYLVPFMRERLYEYEIERYGTNPHKIKYFNWVNKEDSRFIYARIEIIDDNIALVACEAFMEVELCL